MLDKFRPCPLCGDRFLTIEATLSDDIPGFAVISCRFCGLGLSVSGSSIYDDLEGLLLDRWNNRVSDLAPDQEVTENVH